jgi:hypothetical protein
MSGDVLLLYMSEFQVGFQPIALPAPHAADGYWIDSVYHLIG